MVNITDEQPNLNPYPGTVKEHPGKKESNPPLSPLITKEGFFDKMERIESESKNKCAKIDQETMEQMKKVDPGTLNPYPEGYSNNDSTTGMTEEDLMKKAGFVVSGEDSFPSVVIRTRKFYMDNPELSTFGQEAVKVSLRRPDTENAFDNYKADRVFRLNMLHAEIIDILNDFRRGETEKTNEGFGGMMATIPSDEQKRLASIAITQAQTAQMWAVKAITWKDQE
jgi:hypothetical protein